MKKIFILVLLLVAIILVSCNNETSSESIPSESTPSESTPNESTDGTTSHVHDFSGELKYDKNGHYTTCECGEVSRSEHVEGSSLVVKKSSCFAEGQKFVVCKECGYREIISLPKLDHTHEKHEAVTATCIQKGVTAYEHCDICNIDIGKEFIPKISHDYQDGFCTMCGSHEPSEYIKFELLNGGWTAILDYQSGMDKDTLPLTELYIPSYTDTGEKVVSVSGFSNLKQLKKVILPKTVTKICKSAFAGCLNLEEVEFLGDESSWLEIHDKAFFSCTKLKKINFMDNVVYLGSSAFYTCKSLESIEIPSTITELKDGLFYGCTSLKKVVLPDTITTVDLAVFSQCYSLKEVNLGNGITNLSKYMFAGCSSIESIVIPDSVTFLDEKAFYGCEKLKTVILPKNLTTMRNAVFAACIPLESITIPKSIEHLGVGIFDNCKSLKLINYEGTIDDWNNLRLRGGMFAGSSVERIICSDGVIEV